MIYAVELSREVALPVAVVLVVVVVFPVVIPLPVSVFETTPIPIGIAYPPALTAVHSVVAVFRLTPTSVPVVVALDPHAMIAVGIAALVGVGKRD